MHHAPLSGFPQHMDIWMLIFFSARQNTDKFPYKGKDMLWDFSLRGGERWLQSM